MELAAQRNSHRCLTGYAAPFTGWLLTKERAHEHYGYSSSRRVVEKLSAFRV
jgi:hypothetical protein